jgi:hypothetical protein
MEFYGEVENKGLSVKDLQEQVSINNLADLCESIAEVIEDEGHKGLLWTIWGEFIVNREEIIHGVRFTYPQCPNVIAWTITLEDEEKNIRVHCTINRKEHDQDFIESIEDFVADWEVGLEKALDKKVAVNS